MAALAIVPSMFSCAEVGAVASESASGSRAPLFAAELFADLIASQVLGSDGESMSVGVVHADGTTFTAVRHRGEDPGLSVDTPFRLASVSKTITATVVLRLVDSGALSLNDRPLVGLLERRGVRCSVATLDRITVRDLLSHTSGFDSGRELFFDEIVDDPARLVERLCDRGSRSAPGTRFDYGNVNYLLLGWLIEELTGLDYASAVHRWLSGPFGLPGLVYRDDSEVAPDEPSYFVDPGSNYMELLGAAGAWSATSLDAARFIHVLMSSRTGRGPLTRGSWAAMRSPTPRSAAGASWGYGWGVRLFDDGVWGHTGSIDSIRTIVVGLPDGGAVAVLVDGDSPARTDDLVGIVTTAWWMCHHSGFLLAVPAT